MTAKKGKGAPAEAETPTDTTPDPEEAPVTTETPPEGTDEATPTEDVSEAPEAETATETAEAPEAALTSTEAPADEPAPYSPAPGAPRFCGVCGERLTLTTTEVDRGFNLETGERLSPGHRSVVDCPTGRIFHTKSESIDGSPWAVPQ